MSAPDRPLPWGEDDLLDAVRMRALARCPGVAMHGSAGVDPVRGGRLYLDEPGQVHFGAAFAVEGADEVSTAWGRHAIVAIADDVLHLETGSAPTSLVGESLADDAARFRALMRLPRIRIMAVENGGRDPTHPVADPDEPGRFSFRAELWSSPATFSSTQCDPHMGRRCILVLADDILKSGPTREDPASAGL